MAINNNSTLYTHTYLKESKQMGLMSKKDPSITVEINNPWFMEFRLGAQDGGRKGLNGENV